ncbi:EAL domain-containing protein [Rhodothalassium salexigens]|uniref:EAL domain-containing protein n=1 Tax=Rhodothalassium salexigens TaxID=1086 RepID=UPI0019133098
MTVPDRFLGVAFAAGDIVLELDSDYRILHADGAVTGTALGGAKAPLALPDAIAADDRPALHGAFDALSSTFRSGPIRLRLPCDDGEMRPFIANFGRLPHRDGRFYALLTSPDHYGTTAPLIDHLVSARNRPDGGRAMLERLARLLTEPSAGPADDGVPHRLLTVLETLGDDDLNDAQVRAFEQRLSAMSLGGQGAIKLSDHRFAVVQEDTGDGAATRAMIAGLGEATGVDVRSATLDPSRALDREDAVRAIVYCLQQFTEDAQGFDINSLSTNFASVIREANDNVGQFRRVLSEGAFSLVFQPIVTLANGVPHHYEVLARFDQTEGQTGTQANGPARPSPHATIAFAERTGLIEEFDRAVITRVIDKLNQIDDRHRPPRVAVNISGRSLQSDPFVTELLRQLARHQRLSDRLSLEITESAEIKAPETLQSTINRVRDLGFKVYLDDFGAGGAGFRYLKALRVDGVKIDGSYIRDAQRSHRDHAFLRCMVGLCRDLDIKTVGEWVETPEQAAMLRGLGVDYAQGFLYGHPQPGLKVTPRSAVG